MYALFATIYSLFALLFPASSYCGEEALVEKSLPMVECKYEIMDEEIMHFLQNNPASESSDTCFWNLYYERRETDDPYQCFLLWQEAGCKPEVGCAYLQYGRNIIVLQEEPSEAFFNRIQGKDRRITMQERGTPEIFWAPYLELRVLLRDHPYFKVKCHCELSADVTFLADKSQNDENLITWTADWCKETDVRISLYLPLAECVNPILDKEIRRYLEQRPRTGEVTYWNLTLKKESYTYCDSKVYQCIISRTLSDYTPDAGTAFLQYGNNILVIRNRLDGSVFKVLDGQERCIPLLINRVPCNTTLNCLYVSFTRERFLKKYSESYVSMLR